MFHRPPPELILTCVRGVRAGAASTEGLTDVQASMIAAMAGQIFATPVEPGALEPIGPEELAAAVADPALRHQMVVAMLSLSLMAHPPDPDGPERIAAHPRAPDGDEGMGAAPRPHPDGDRAGMV